MAAGGQALSGIRWSDAMAAARGARVGVRLDFTREQIERGCIRSGPPEGVERRRSSWRHRALSLSSAETGREELQLAALARAGR